MLQYAENGAESQLFGGERYLWIVARQHMDREAEAYEAKKEGLSKNGKKGAAARWSHRESADGKCHADHGPDGQDNDNDKYKDNERGRDTLSLFSPVGYFFLKREKMPPVIYS